ncbi:hypothetical protein [Corynebacterium hindlerae]|uniref:hypothetical protein n=1 Tax=Corynebacterium hindlerae TaxID=699041 RepID=UPI003AB0AA02
MIKAQHTTSTFPLSTPDAVAHIRQHSQRALDTVAMTMSHPRSLARETPTWRPPTIRMNPEFGLSSINFTISRRRVGQLARARIRGYGETRTAAYLMTVRLTASDGRQLCHTEAESWIRALLPDAGQYTVHRMAGAGAPTYCWVVDQHFQPIESPASLFHPATSAA